MPKKTMILGFAVSKGDSVQESPKKRKRKPKPKKTTTKIEVKTNGNDTRI